MGWGRRHSGKPNITWGLSPCCKHAGAPQTPLSPLPFNLTQQKNRMADRIHPPAQPLSHHRVFWYSMLRHKVHVGYHDTWHLYSSHSLSVAIKIYVLLTWPFNAASTFFSHHKEWTRQGERRGKREARGREREVEKANNFVYHLENIGWFGGGGVYNILININIRFFLSYGLSTIFVSILH